MGIPDILLSLGGAVGLLGAVASIIHGAATAALHVKKAPITAALYAKRTLAISVVAFVVAFVLDAAAVALTSSQSGEQSVALHAVVGATMAALIRTALLLALPTAVAAVVLWKRRAATT